MRMTSITKKKIDFFVGGNTISFGIREFALITGLNCGKLPKNLPGEGDGVPRLVTKYLPTNSKVYFTQLETAFNLCNDDNDDAYKLGLITLVCNYLMGSEVKKEVPMWYFHLAEDEEAFVKFAWGKIVFMETIKGLTKDMIHYKNLHLNKEEKGQRLLLNLKRVERSPPKSKTLHTLCMGFQLPCRYGHMR